MGTIKTIITSRFGDTTGRTKPHEGVDTAFGVYAMADGVVVAGGAATGRIAVGSLVKA